MRFTKEISPARKIDAFRSFAAQIKDAFVSTRGGVVTVTEHQTNSYGLDCQWTASSEEAAAADLTSRGYVLAAA